LAQAPPDAEKGFLGHVLGAGAVAAVAPGEVDERTLPALDDLREGLHIAAEDAVNEGRFQVRGAARRSGRRVLRACRFPFFGNGFRRQA
jgi:hypothetical protein